MRYGQYVYKLALTVGARLCVHLKKLIGMGYIPLPVIGFKYAF